MESLLISNKDTKQFKEKLTEEIVLGDCVPVTETLKEPPIVKERIKLSNYLSPNEYIYGSEYFKAKNMMEEAMNGREKIPAGGGKKITIITLPTIYFQGKFGKKS